jgi:hypothetical protein
VSNPASRVPTDHGPAADDGADSHLPRPSIWPIVCAGGVALLGFGVLTSLVFSAIGAGLLAWSLVGWIRELLNE